MEVKNINNMRKILIIFSKVPLLFLRISFLLIYFCLFILSKIYFIKKYISKPLTMMKELNIKWIVHHASDLSTINPNSAISFLENHLVFYPNNLQIIKLIAIIYDKTLNDHEKAAYYFGKILEENNKDKEAAKGLFLHYIKTEQLEKAIEIKIVEDNNEEEIFSLAIWDIFIFPLIDVDHKKRDEFRKFFPHLEQELVKVNRFNFDKRFIEINNSESKLQNILVMTALDALLLNKDREIFQILKEQLIRFPNNFLVRLLYQCFAFRLNFLDESIKENEFILNHISKYYPIYLNTINYFYGIVHYRMHDLARAEIYLKKSYNIHPTKIVCFILGDIYCKNENYEYAINYYKKVFFAENRIPSSIYDKTLDNYLIGKKEININVLLFPSYEGIVLQSIIRIFETKKRYKEILFFLKEIKELNLSVDVTHYIMEYLAQLTELEFSDLEKFELYKTYLEKLKKIIPNSDAYHSYTTQKENIAYKKKLIKAEKDKSQIEFDTRQDLLSFLSHTFRNSLSNGTETIRETLSLAKKALEKDYEDKLAYKAFNNLAGLFSTFSMVESMLDTFKLFTQEKEVFKQEWKKSISGDKDVKYLFTLAIRQNLSRFLFSEGLIEERQRMINPFSSEGLRNLRKKFLLEILSEDFENVTTDYLLNWYQENISFIRISIQDSRTTFNIRGVHFNLIYSIISETIFNALKYSSGDNPIEISWKRKDMNLYYECKNNYSEDTIRNSDSRSGLRFIKNLVENIENVKFERVSNDKIFNSTLEVYNIGGQ